MKIEEFDNFFKKIKDKNIYIGFSGGSDSRFILHIANIYKSKYNLNIKAINFEHGIRGCESIKDSNFCKEVCNKLNIPIKVIHLNISKDTKNIECVARDKRLNYYNKIALKDKNNIILLGHHKDDLIENFFIRLSRGSNLTGLTSLKEFCYIGDILIGRPLLNYNKDDIVSYLNKNKIDFVVDSTNFNLDYNRNYLRNFLLKSWFEKFVFVKSGIFKSLQNLCIDNDFIEKTVDNEFEKIYLYYRNNTPVDIGYYLNLHEAIRFRVLKKHIRLYFDDFEMTNGIMTSFNNMIKSYNNTGHKKIRIGDNRFIVIKGYKLFFEKIKEKKLCQKD